MPSATPAPGSGTATGGRGAVILTLALVAAATVAARLPFLLHGAYFFDSDEAVEGLMARHVLHGEFPSYLWGQRYKGVPEVYLAAATFRLWPATGAGGAAAVVALKAVTLVCFALYAALNFRLVAQLFSRRVAWITTAFVIAGPPSTVFWGLSGSAEFVMTFIVGTSLLLGLAAWQKTGSRAGLVTAAAALGFGMWIQQYILYYLAAVAVAFIGWPPQGFKRLRELAASMELPFWLRVAAQLCAIAASLYVLLGLAAFFGLGFSVTLAGVTITVTHPQKMWWIAAGLMLAGAAGGVAALLLRSRTRKFWLAPALAFLIGFAPAIAGRLTAPGAGAPIARMDFTGLQAALAPFAGTALPIILGFKTPGIERLTVPAWAALLIAAVIVASYVGLLRMRRDEPPPLSSVFHVFLILTPIVFAASGAFIDVQSYRYLMPIHAALPVVYAVGVDATWRLNRIAGVLMLAALAAVFVAQQAEWYRRLQPDREADTIVRCLDDANVRAASADYWLAYKLTYLTGERVIVSPTNGVDRYPPYTAITRAAAGAPEIERLPANAAGMRCEAILHRTAP